MSTRVTRGRGRGRATASSGGRPEASSAHDDTENDTANRVMDVDEPGAEADSATTTLARGSSISRSGAGTSRGVGGLLAESSEYARKSTPGPSTATSSKLKFVPNMRRKVKPKVEDDDDDVKMEDVERRPRAPRARAPRQELQMTATGAFAAGPGGAPRGFTPRANFGPEGSGVMDASRNGIVRGRYDADAELDPDYDSEIEGGEENEGGEQIRTASGGIKIIARHLDTIGAEHEMAPTVLPKDPTVEKAAHERRKERRERRIKAEAEKVKMEDGVEASAVASGHIVPDVDSKEASTIDSKETTAEPDVKLEVKREEEARANMRAMFDTPAGPDVSELFIFQFPRKFPRLVATDDNGAALADAVDTKVKLEDAAGAGSLAATAAKRSKQVPDWGRTGSRTQKAVRWSNEKGLVGQMKVYQSGRVTLTVNGDLTYEIEPAVQPSFLQEVVVLDQPTPNAGSDGKKSTRGMACLGQTNRKLMVMPVVDELLDKVAEQVKEEKRAEAALKKAVKKERVKDE